MIIYNTKIIFKNKYWNKTPIISYKGYKFWAVPWFGLKYIHEVLKIL